MDYKEMWRRLREELENMDQRNFIYVHPATVLNTMSHLEQLCDSEHKSE